MVIQIVTNMFEKMETAIGLPQEFRMGTCDNERGGLLRDEDLLKFAKSMIQKEDIGRPEEGKGGIKSIRKNMKTAKRLLRDRIAP